MYKILHKETLAQDTILMDILAPWVAKSALPGQFMIIKATETSERIPLTISDSDPEKGIVSMVVKAIGSSTKEMVSFEVGDYFSDVVGPLGKPSEFVHIPIEKLKKMNFAFLAGGVGIAPIYPLVKWMYKHGIKSDVIIGARTKDLLFFEDKLRLVAGNLYIVTDDNSYGVKGVVTDILKNLVNVEHKKYDEITAIGPMIMMKFVAKTAKELGIKCTVSLNSLMVDGTGMCGACRVQIGGETKFTCVDGPEFDATLVDFDECMMRQAMYNTVEGKKQLDREEKEEGHECHIGGIVEGKRDRKKQVPVREQDPVIRSKNFEEVCYGYNAEEAMEEAQRCLNCKNPLCVSGCPVAIKIPQFISSIAKGAFEEAAKIINEDSALPAICGRVCPQESQCEGKCILGKKGDSIAIGKLERFVGDWTRENNISFVNPIEKNGYKVAVIGSGPAGLTCAKELLMMGYDVTIFEALHEYGGVLVYGIPSFRLPKETVVKYEIDNIGKLGAKFEKNVVVGRSVTIDDLFDKEKYDALFLATGAGFPNFMNIPGENLCGVVSANEFLTRNNLLFSYKQGYDTPNFVGNKVAVVGGGNVAMDAARTAKRLGSDVYIVYRRSLEELPARVEEVHHAEQEGIKFNLLTNPLEVLGDEKGWVKGMKCIKMELGEPDSSGRRRPIEIPGSEFILDVDMMIMSIGTSPNPLILSTTHGIDVNKKGCVVVDDNGCTSREGVFAGGDVTSGSATVILAMGAGKTAAKAIDEYVKSRK